MGTAILTRARNLVRTKTPGDWPTGRQVYQHLAAPLVCKITSLAGKGKTPPSGKPALTASSFSCSTAPAGSSAGSPCPAAHIPLSASRRSGIGQRTLRCSAKARGIVAQYGTAADGLRSHRAARFPSYSPRWLRRPSGTRAQVWGSKQRRFVPQCRAQSVARIRSQKMGRFRSRHSSRVAARKGAANVSLNVWIFGFARLRNSFFTAFQTATQYSR